MHPKSCTKSKQLSYMARMLLFIQCDHTGRRFQPVFSYVMVHSILKGFSLDSNAGVGVFLTLCNSVSHKQHLDFVLVTESNLKKIV